MALVTLKTDESATPGAPGIVFDRQGDGSNAEVAKAAFGTAGSITLVDPANPMPTHDATAATEATLAAGLGADGANPPVVAGTGIRGWLRAIYERLTGTLTVSTGLNQPLTDAQLRASVVAVYDDAVNQAALSTFSATLDNTTAIQALVQATGAKADGAATSDTGSFSLIALIKRLLGKWPSLTSTVPDNTSPAVPVRAIGEDIWTCSFAKTRSSIDPEFFAPTIAGTGVGQSQASGNLVITTGTTANAEYLTRSVQAWRGAWAMRWQSLLSQRIANNNFMVLMADLIGEGLSCTINSATSITVALPNHTYTAEHVGQSMYIGGIVGAAGVPGRYAIASVVAGVSVTFTVAGWPATGTCTLTLFGHSYARTLYDGTTATTAKFDCQRKGWNSGDSTATINTSASPGHIGQVLNHGRQIFFEDMLAANTAWTYLNTATRAERRANLPDDNLDLYLFLWAFNGTAAPASTTTWTVGFVSVEKYANLPVILAGMKAQGAAQTIPMAITGGSTVLNGSTARAGFIAGSGIWYDDSSTVLAAAASFTGTSRDLAAVATATTFNSASTYASELRVSAESDQTGTLWLEVSRDGTTWRRVKSVDTTAVTGGGYYAEIIFKPSWRYARVGYTNGATLQTRFSLGSILMAST